MSDVANGSLEELSTLICLKMESLTPSSIDELNSLISSLYTGLAKVSSRFIDIDPSLKDDEAELREQTYQKLNTCFERERADQLFSLYETLKSYLYMKTKHGEAADWFLKNELIR